MSSTSTALFYLLLTFAALFVARIVENRRRSNVRYLPGPSRKIASWLWGHELSVFEHEAVELYTKWVKQFGPMLRIKGALFHSDIIVAADHAAVQHIFADTYTYVKSPQFRPPIANLIGKGLVWAEGEEHAHQRRVLAPAFSAENVKGMADDILECAEKMESRLTNMILAENSGSTTINIVEHMSACTLDVIGRVAFGFDFQSGQSPEARAIAESWQHHIDLGVTFNGFMGLIVLRALPFITSLPIKAIQAQGILKTLVGGMAKKMIEHAGYDQRTGSLKAGSHAEKGKDILSILLRAASKGSGQGERLSTENLIDNISTLTMVGHETIAGAINFTLLSLAQNPEIQQRLRDEVLQVGELSYDSVQKLPYLDAVVKEGLRVHPSSPQTERVVLRDDVIPLSKPITTEDGTVVKELKVKEGQVFHIPFMAMQANPAVWGADAAEFKPERWITPGGMPPPSELPHGWSNMVTFCDGPRNCIGYRLAVLEFKVILATLIRVLEFKETTAHVNRKISSTLQPVTDGRVGVLPLSISIASRA